VKYFIDNCISFRFADMLRALEVEIVALREEFPQDMADIALFQELNGRKLAFVSTDTNQRTRVQEARALKSAGVTSLFIAPFFQKMQFWDQAAWLVRRWPDIDRFATSMELGVCAEIKHNGNAMIYPL